MEILTPPESLPYQVVSNLMINHIELRSEESGDIVQYTHQRNVELMVVDVGPTINRIKARYVAVGVGLI